MNARQKAKRYKALYEMATKKSVPAIFHTITKPTTMLKASVIVSPEEMRSGIPIKALLARRFAEKLEDYMTITREWNSEGIIGNDRIRLTGTIEIVGKSDENNEESAANDRDARRNI